MIKDPQFGEALPIRRSDETLDFLSLRRSASAATLHAPGPDETQLVELLKIAARVPDHGKLSPWRFLVIQGDAKAGLVAKLEALSATRQDAAKAKAVLEKLRAPPVTVAVISRVVEGSIPEWEQILSAGAVCTLLLTAASAMGFGANWITDWYSYDEQAKTLLGLDKTERIAGFVHIGTPSEAPLERARPAMETLIQRL